MDILCSKNILYPDPFLVISKYPACQMDIYPYHISTIWIYILPSVGLKCDKSISKSDHLEKNEQITL